MISALGKAFAQLLDPRLNWVVLVSVLGALATSALVLWIAFSMTGWFDYFEEGWLDWIANAATWLLGLVFVFFLFPAFVTIIASMLLEYVVRAVEARHYPDLPAARDVSIWEDIAYGIKFALVLIGINLLALPIYLILAFLPPLGFIFSWILNGYLIGREYFEMVAMRRMQLPEAKTLRRARRGEVFGAGVVCAVVMTIPIVNLISPVVATAYMTHVFHRIQGNAPARRGAGTPRASGERVEPRL